MGLDAGKDYNLLSRVNVNWLDEVLSTTVLLSRAQASVNRATDRLNYYVYWWLRPGWYRAELYLPPLRTYHTNADVKASNWLKIGTDPSGSYEEAQQATMVLIPPLPQSRLAASCPLTGIHTHRMAAGFSLRRQLGWYEREP